MRTIRISDEVYREIAKRGSFGETVDDVLRAVFGVKKSQRQKGPPSRVILAQRKMTAEVRVHGTNDILSVRFDEGASRQWDLNPKTDVTALRVVTDEALAFAESEGATKGQLQYIRKALSQSGYYLRGPRQ